MNRCVPQRLFTSCPHLQALLLPNEVGQTWPMPAHDGRVSLLLRDPRPARDRSQRENESLSSFCRGFLKQVMGSFAPASPLWVCRTRRQGRRIRHGLEALPAAKTACHPVVLMMKGFTAATKRPAQGRTAQGKVDGMDEAAQGSADGTGGAASPRQVPATTGPTAGSGPTAGLGRRMATHRIAQDDLAPGFGLNCHSGWIAQSAGSSGKPGRCQTNH